MIFLINAAWLIEELASFSVGLIVWGFLPTLHAADLIWNILLHRVTLPTLTEREKLLRLKIGLSNNFLLTNENLGYVFRRMASLVLLSLRLPIVERCWNLLALFKHLTTGKAVEFTFGLIVHQRKPLGYFNPTSAFASLMWDVKVLAQNLAREALVFYRILNKLLIHDRHTVKVGLLDGLLDPVANVVDPAGAHIATCWLK